MVSQACLLRLRQDGGRIVTVGSVSGRTVTRSTGAHSAAKSGQHALSVSLRMELAPWNIPVSLIEMGNVKTLLWDKAWDSFEQLRESVPEEALALYYPDWPATLDRGRVDVSRHLQHAVSADQVARLIAKVLTA